MSQEVVKRLVDELAPVVWAERCHEAAATMPPQTVPWYFININHPTVRTIYDRYRRKASILGPPTDLERVKFELYVLHPDEGIKRAYNYGRHVLAKKFL